MVQFTSTKIYSGALNICAKPPNNFSNMFQNLVEQLTVDEHLLQSKFTMSLSHKVNQSRESNSQTLRPCSVVMVGIPL
jgi:hypothetical protein